MSWHGCSVSSRTARRCFSRWAAFSHRMALWSRPVGEAQGSDGGRRAAAVPHFPEARPVKRRDAQWIRIVFGPLPWPRSVTPGRARSVMHPLGPVATPVAQSGAPIEAPPRIERDPDRSFSSTAKYGRVAPFLPVCTPSPPSVATRPPHVLERTLTRTPRRPRKNEVRRVCTPRAVAMSAIDASDAWSLGRLLRAAPPCIRAVGTRR